MRRHGANEAFGERHPYWALLFGGAHARAHAHKELGRRHWLVTLFGARMGSVMAAGLVSVACWQVVGHVDWSRLWPWGAGVVAVVTVVAIGVRWWRSPYRF
jgi:hypothetical protein